MKNVLDLTRRLKKKAKAAKPTKSTTQKTGTAKAAQVLDMTERRNEILQQERRQVKRTLLTEFIGAFALVPQKGLLKVTLYDISEQGLAFDMENAAGHYSLGEEVAMRVYLSQSTYFPFVVTVQNIRTIGEESVYRHGVNFVSDSINMEALHHFVKFIETVSSSLHGDEGDLVVSSLTR
jgi:hypothetical protein